jgi:threonylcarbamoyladenosine tRNA methylthiotransferase MtaB
MKRRYQREIYTERVNKIREVTMLHVWLLVFLKLMNISWNLSLFEWNGHFYLHVFKYSERDNTEAAEIGGVPENVRVKRSKMMRGLKKRRSFMKAK